MLAYLDPGSGSMIRRTCRPSSSSAWSSASGPSSTPSSGSNRLVGRNYCRVAVRLGWLVALIYLLAIRPGLARSDTQVESSTSGI